MLQGNSKDFIWSKTCERHFQFLKTCFTTELILQYFDPNLETFLETDASDFAIASVLCQHHNSKLHPVTFFSRKLNPAEVNYEIHNKEILTIVQCFKQW